MASLDIHLFGTPSIVCDGKEIGFPYKKASVLFFCLLLQRKWLRSQLASLIWPDEDPSTSLKNLRHAAHTIRKSIGLNPFLSSDRSILELSPDVNICCDVWSFDQTGDPMFCRGRLLEGYYVPQCDTLDEWLENKRTQYHNKYLSCLLSTIKSNFQRGDYSAAEQCASSFLAIDPLDENVTCMMMQLCAKQRKYRKAINVYNNLCKLLSNELSIAPLKETTSLYYSIINDWNLSVSKDINTNTVQPLWGKETALHSLVSFYEDFSKQSSKCCIILSGVAGVGKTHLLNHFLTNYDFSDYMILRSFSSRTESGMQYSSWNSIFLTLTSEISSGHIHIPVSFLRAAVGIFPCLASSAIFNTAFPEENLNSNADSRAAQDAALLILLYCAKQNPILLVFEDIQWMDAQSIELLRLALHRIGNYPIRVLCTARTPFSLQVRHFVDDASVDRLLENVTLLELTKDDTRGFVQHLLCADPDDGVLDTIYQSTNGNPLLLTQLLSFIREGKEPSSFPSSFDEIIMNRISALAQEEISVLEAMSIFNRWISIDMLSSILTTSPLELTCLCDQLCQKMLLKEEVHDDQLGYFFSHEKIQSFVGKRIRESFRRILHLRIAEYLAAQSTSSDIFPYEQVIFHYASGGDRYKAFKYRVLFLSMASNLCCEMLPILTSSANAPFADEQQAINQFILLRQELSYLKSIHFSPDTDELDALELSLLYTEAQYYVHSGNYHQALPLLDLLLECSSAMHNLSMTIHTHFQFVYYAVQIYDTSIMAEHLSAISDCVRNTQDKAIYASYLRLFGLLKIMQGNYEASRVPLEESLSVLLSLDDSSRFILLIAGAYNYIGESLRLEKKYQEAFYYYDKAIVYNRGSGQYPGAAVFYTNYGVAAFQAGRYYESRCLFDCAELIYSSFYEYSEYPIALSYLAYFDASNGNYSGALNRLTNALSISKQFGSPWWLGITIYMAWRIRQILPCSEQDAFWEIFPRDEKEHCLWALSYLHRTETRCEAKELEQRLRVLDSEESSIS